MEYNAALAQNTAAQENLILAQGIANQSDGDLGVQAAYKTGAENDYDSALAAQNNAITGLSVAEETLISADILLTDKTIAKDIAIAEYNFALEKNETAQDNLMSAQLAADEAAVLLAGEANSVAGWRFDGNDRIIAEINEPETDISREIVFK